MRSRLPGCALLLVTALFASAAPVAAVELSAEEKAQVAATYAEMRRCDLWSAMQVEAWAEQQKLTLKGVGRVLGASDVMGEPLFAFPDDVRLVADRGEVVDVLTSARWHQIAPDGRPLTPSIELGIECMKGDFAFSRGFVAAAAVEPLPDDAGRRWRVRVVAVPGGALAFEARADLPPGIRFGEGEARVADDGSAMALPMRDAERERRAVVVARKEKDPLLLEGLFDPLGVGSDGAWLIARVSKPQPPRPLVLAVGDARTEVRAAAVGPGIAAVADAQRQVLLVDRAGRTTPLPLPINLGEAPRLATLGAWLVVSSGPGARSKTAIDLLGRPLPDPPAQPDTLALFRWADLAEGRHAAVACVSTPYQPALHLPAAIYAWRSRQLDVIDLTGAKPERRPLYTAPREITWAWASRFWTRVNMRGGSAVIDEAGRELQAGEGEAIVVARDHAVVVHPDERNPQRHELVQLSLVPEERRPVDLALGGGLWTFIADPQVRRLLAVQDSRSRMYDLDGKPQALLAEGAPPLHEIWPPHGRFFPRFGRLHAKATGVPADEDGRFAPQDAWMASAKLRLVLTRDERVIGQGLGKRARDWMDFGACLGGRRFALMKDEPVLTDDARAIVGVLQAGSGSLTVKPERNGRLAEALPEGRWRVQQSMLGYEFAPPNGGAMVWAPEKAGFTPRFLRSARGNDIALVVTASLVIALDPAVAKSVAGSRR